MINTTHVTAIIERTPDVMVSFAKTMYCSKSRKSSEYEYRPSNPNSFSILRMSKR